MSKDRSRPSGSNIKGTDLDDDGPFAHTKLQMTDAFDFDRMSEDRARPSRSNIKGTDLDDDGPFAHTKPQMTDAFDFDQSWAAQWAESFGSEGTDMSSISMKKSTHELLQISIQQWEKNITAVAVEDVSIGPAKRALCDAFYGQKNCDGCPVQDTTGKPHCHGTPMKSAEIAYVRWVNGHTGAHTSFLEAAQAELSFLRSLVPTDGPDEQG